MANRASKSSGRIRSTDSRPWGKHKPLLTSCIDDRKWIAACRSRATRLSAPSRASYPPPHALAGRVVAPLPNIPFPQPRSVLPPLRALAPPVRPVPGRAAAGCSRLRCGPTRRAGRPADPSVQFKLNFLGRPRLFAPAHVTQIQPLLFMKTVPLKLVATPVMSECPRPDWLMGFEEV